METKNTTLFEECGGLIKIIAITGIRSEYDLLKPLLKALEADSAFKLGIVVAGAHLTPLHDYSVRQIENDDFTIVERIENLIHSNSFLGKLKSTGLLIQGLGQVISREKPDLLIVIGDREEAIAGSLSGSYMSTPVVHIAGGDNTHPIGGNVDEEVRHATTKLSHIHLTMAEEFKQRVINLGEEPWRVFTVGSGGIDNLRTEKVADLDELSQVLGKDVFENYLTLIHHPLNSQLEHTAEEMRVCLEACVQSGYKIFVGAPNSDPGFEDIAKVIDEYSNNKNVHIYRNLSRYDFVSLLRNSRCLVGNSSLALHEAPFIGLPCVNVGERQRGRLADNNIQFVPVELNKIISAIKKAVNDENYRKSIGKESSPYGDGFMSEKSIKIIKALPNKKKLLAKKITF